MPDILCDTREGILTLTISNPQRRNAVTLEMWKTLRGRLDEAATDGSVRVVVVTGAPSPSFVSGADISEFDSYLASEAAREAFSQAAQSAMAALHGFPKPVIAKIGGDCIGGGLALAVCCDIRYTVDGARFGIPAARLGLGYGVHSVRNLVAVTGEAVAADLLYSARYYKADEALRCGIVHRVLAADELDEAVGSLARRIAGNAPLTVAAAKLALRAVSAGSGGDEAERAVRRCFQSEDFREGVRAFREKRPPAFRGE